ncbi:MAG: gliding motility-associated C-terminal domain-containing protein [Bacteroidota bacterium]
MLDDNQDGRIDILINGLDSLQRRVSLVYHGKGKFKFDLDKTSLKTLALDSLLLDSLTTDSLAMDAVAADSLAFSNVAVGDYDHDGHTDVLLTGTGNDKKTHSTLFFRRKTGFQTAKLPLVPLHSGSAFLADLDNDGRTDILLTGLNEKDSVIHQLYRNYKDDSVRVVKLPFVANKYISTTLGDFTGDGNLDILQTGISTDSTLKDTVSTQLYRNTTLEKNNGAVAPAYSDSTYVVTIGDRATFFWTSGWDDTTSTAALTYDVYIRTVGTGKLQKAPEANEITSFRWVVAHGSQGQTSTCIVEGLPEGDFDWDIIAVDNAFQSGRPVYTPGEGTGVVKARRFKVCDNVVRRDTAICVKSNLTLTSAEPVIWFSSEQGILTKTKEKALKDYHVTEADTIYAVYSLENKCTEGFYMVVTAAPPPKFSLGNDTIVCPNVPATFDAGAGWKKVQWYVQGKGMVQSSATLTHSFSDAALVWAEVTNGTGCVVSDTIKVDVYELPKLALTEVSFLEGESVTLEATGGATYQWSPATGLSDPNSANPVASPEVSTTYYLTIITSNGCESKDTIKVTVNKIIPNIFIPSLFTPNSDGQNDKFLIYGAGFLQLSLQVYDRSGSLVYETNDVKAALSQGWDGQVNGNPQPNGTYLWTIKGSFTDGSEVQYKGKKSGIINLMR